MPQLEHFAAKDLVANHSDSDNQADQDDIARFHHFELDPAEQSALYRALSRLNYFATDNVTDWYDRYTSMQQVSDESAIFNLALQSFSLFETTVEGLIYFGQSGLPEADTFTEQLLSQNVSAILEHIPPPAQLSSHSYYAILAIGYLTSLEGNISHQVRQHLNSWPSDSLEGLSIAGQASEQYAHLLLEYGNQEQQTIAAQALNEYLDRADDDKFKRLGECLGRGWHSSQRLAFKHLEKVLEPCRLPADRLLDDWRKSCPPLSIREDSFAYLIRQNLNTIQALENQSGCSSYLYEQWGVSDFSRYPIELLSKQYDQRQPISPGQEGQPTPYGVIIYPKSDWNGAFYYIVPALATLTEDLAGVSNIKVMECNTKLEMVERINWMRKNFGQAEFAIVGGHGNPSTIQLGELNRQDYSTLSYEEFSKKEIKNCEISLDDISGQRTGSLQSAFTGDAMVIFVACSTGLPGGPAHKLSNRSNVFVFAPDSDTSLDTLSGYRGGDGKLILGVKYSSASSNVYTRGQQIIT